MTRSPHDRTDPLATDVGERVGSAEAQVAGFDWLGTSEAADVLVAQLENLGPTDGTGPTRVADLDNAGVDSPRRAIAVAALDGAQARTGAPRGSQRSGAPRKRTAGHRTAAGGSAGKEPAGPCGTPDTDPRDADADPESVARATCLQLLTDRARTRQELEQALRRKGVPDEAASAVLERFGDVGLIDDGAFAEQWVRSRHTVGGLGRRALAVELRRKGVADDVAGEALAAVDADAEDGRARELVDRKLRSMPSDTEEQRVAAGRRLLGMLARKGYGGGTAYRVVREALAARGAEPADLAAAEPPDHD